MKVSSAQVQERLLLRQGRGSVSMALFMAAYRHAAMQGFGALNEY